MNHLTEKQIQQFIDEPNENIGLKNHLKECSQCKEAYDSLLEIHIQLARMEYEKPSMRFARNIYEIIARKQQLDLQEIKWVRAIRVSLLLSVLLVFLLAFYYILSMQWDLRIDDGSIAEYYQWGITILSTVIMLWILYGIDHWYGVKQGPKTKR